MSALSPAAPGVRGMHRDYTITRTMNAWPVEPNGEMSSLSADVCPMKNSPALLRRIG
jgi:hypothetical protein